MHLVPLPLALIQKRQFEQSPDVGAVAGQSDEQRHVIGVVLDALAVRVEIYRPRVAADHKRFGPDVLSDPHALGERVPTDLEFVASIDGFGARRRTRGRRRQRQRRRGF